MAEFVQTMKDWRRMCEHCDRNERIVCVVNGSVCAGFRKMIDEIDLEVVETKVTAWAAEHPEPVYPTWMEWLTEMGAIPKVISWDEPLVEAVYDALQEHIPAEFAQNLGIKPKEG